MSDQPKFVSDLMTRDLVTLRRDEKLMVADDVMRLGRIRHIPIVDKTGALVGIVSQRDLFHKGLLKALGGSDAQRQALDAVSIEEAMSSPVATTGPDALLKDAARRMLRNKIGCLVVVEAGKIVGILTEGDFLALAAS